MMAPASPCRVHVFLSRKSPVGVLLRRGPSAWAQLIYWDRSRDVFTPGQWFHGRIYERRCDLSPNGLLFVYFAAKYGSRQLASDIGEAWTAISRPPYFTALCLWDNIGSWYGGGVFRTDRQLELDATCSLTPHTGYSAGKLKLAAMAATTAPWEQRLLRDGWHLVERGFEPRNYRCIGEREIWRKEHPEGKVTLVQEAEDVDFRRYGGLYASTYRLETPDGDLPLSDVTWADWDTWQRLVAVRNGALYVADTKSAELGQSPLFDPNPLSPYMRVGMSTRLLHGLLRERMILLQQG